MNKGVATACVAGGAVGVAQALVGLVFFVRHDPKRAHFLVGLFVGTTLLVAAVSLGQAGLWMAQWNLIFDLSEIDPASASVDDRSCFLSESRLEFTENRACRSW